MLEIPEDSGKISCTVFNNLMEIDADPCRSQMNPEGLAILSVRAGQASVKTGGQVHHKSCQSSLHSTRNVPKKTYPPPLAARHNWEQLVQLALSQTCMGDINK